MQELLVPVKADRGIIWEEKAKVNMEIHSILPAKFGFFFIICNTVAKASPLMIY